MIHTEAHLSESIGFTVYDGSVITAEELLQYLKERAGGFPAVLVNDHMLGHHSGYHQMHVEQAAD